MTAGASCPAMTNDPHRKARESGLYRPAARRQNATKNVTRVESVAAVQSARGLASRVLAMEETPVKTGLYLDCSTVAAHVSL